MPPSVHSGIGTKALNPPGPYQRLSARRLMSHSPGHRPVLCPLPFPPNGIHQFSCHHSTPLTYATLQRAQLPAVNVAGYAATSRANNDFAVASGLSCNHTKISGHTSSNGSCGFASPC